MVGGETAPTGAPINIVLVETSTTREPFTTKCLIGMEASINMLVEYMSNNPQHLANDPPTMPQVPPIGIYNTRAHTCDIATTSTNQRVSVQYPSRLGPDFVLGGVPGVSNRGRGRPRGGFT